MSDKAISTPHFGHSALKNMNYIRSLGQMFTGKMFLGKTSPLDKIKIVTTDINTIFLLMDNCNRTNVVRAYLPAQECLENKFSNIYK